MTHRSIRSLIVLTLIAGIPRIGLADPPDATDPPVVSAKHALERESRSTLAGEIRKIQTLREQMRAKLDLDEDQTYEVDAMFDEYIDELKEESRAQRENQREHSEEIRDLVRELSEARGDDDRARMAEIREQIAALRSSREDSGVNHDEFFEYVMEVLDDRQIQQFESLVERMGNARDRNRMGPAAEIQRMRRAAGMIETTPEQRNAVREIFRELTVDMREARDDQESMAELVDAIYTRLSEEFDEEQMATFEEKLVQLQQADEARKAGRRSARRPDAPRSASEEPGEDRPDTVHEADAPLDAPDEEVPEDQYSEDGDPDQYDDSADYD